MKIIADLSRLTARRAPDKIAFVMDGESLTYAELDTRSNALANGLLAQGVEFGDRVLLVSATILEYGIYSQAIAKAGAIIVPVNPRLSSDEMAHIFADSDARIAFVHPSLLEVVQQGLASIETKPFIISIGDDAPAGADKAATAVQGAQTRPVLAETTLPEHATTLMYTSGTTGKPKGVLYGNGAHFALYEAQIVELNMHSNDVMHIASPLFTNGGLHGGINCTIWLAAKGIFHTGNFDPERVLSTIRDQGVTIGFWVPTMLSILCDYDGVGGFDLSSVDKIYYGSMPMDPNLLAKARKVFPQAKFYQLYGSTECGFIGSIHPSVGAPYDHCTGRLAFNNESAVLDDNGNEVAIGEIGEIAVRQETSGMIGYWHNPDETARTIRDGWIYSGDLVRREPEGFFTVVGRKRDLIISGAENIYPKEIELVIAESSAVAEVAVFGTPDEKYGEVVCAAIALKPGETLSAQEVDALCLEKLARYKRPRKVEFHDELPKNAMGKVTKQVLREPHWRGLGRSI